MVEWEQPIVDVCVTTRGQRARMLEVDMLLKNFQIEKLAPPKDIKSNGRRKN
jgi:hypothetical protein